MAGCGGGPSSPGSSPASTQPALDGPQSARPRDLDTYLAIIDLATYKNKVAPAFERYVSTGDADALAALVPKVSLPELDDRKKRLEAALKAAPAVMEAKCLVRLPGIEPYQLGTGELVSYLYSASDWLRETLSSKDISDLTLDYGLGEHTEIIRPTDAAEIRVNARNVPVPEDPKVKAQLASFLSMMDAAAKNPNYGLALVMK